ncbi:MAG TPA: EAL domain-containing protein [Xanthomonadaceae bacterium]|nr:EAL domain-containing protein [Xanthomonadaceae bacterium]
MQFGKDMVLRLLIIDDSIEAAESIVSGLRNGGIAVRPSRPESEEEFAEFLGTLPFDLILVAQDAKSITLSQVMQHVDASGKDLPVIVILDTLDNNGLLHALDHGARGVALRSRIDHVQSVARTEWSDLEVRRALRRLEAQVRETERRCDALIESSRDPIAYVHEGMHIRANQAYLEMFGFDSFEDIEGMSLLDLVAPEHLAGFKQLLKSMSKGEPPPPRYELQARDMDGNVFPAVMEFTPASYEGETCLQAVFRRQESDPHLAREVEELRQRDQVTGLLNRQTFLRALEDAVASSATAGANHGLLLLEPDHYVRLLQEIGLDTADPLITALAERLEGVLGEGDIAARFGEHQFAVLCRDSDHVRTTQIAEKVRTAFADHVVEAGAHSLNITASIGGVQIGEKIASVPQVLGKASQGVQSAVAMGGNRSEIFDPGAVDRAEEEKVRAWVSRIRDTLDKGNFHLHYQPVISLAGGDGHELYQGLLRMEGSAGELVSPPAFLPIAEEHGLLWEIDHWVVGRAIEVIGQRLNAGKRTSLLVKITQDSLQDSRLLEHIGKTLDSHKVPGELLVLELSEAKVFTHLRAAQDFQRNVASLGVRVGLEQFGSGLNSFQLLNHFDATLLKIDRDFMLELPTNEKNQERVKEIAAKAREVGKHTVAEFVQDAASMSFLFGAGVDYVQGHFLAAAGPEMNYEFE